jgi:hypothetical protein
MAYAKGLAFNLTCLQLLCPPPSDCKWSPNRLGDRSIAPGQALDRIRRKREQPKCFLGQRPPLVRRFQFFLGGT